MKYIFDKFHEFDITITDYFFCPHHPNEGVGKYKKNCFCRKPNPGMINKACKKYNINPNLSIMVGDSHKDKEAAFNAGVNNYVDTSEILWQEKVKNLILSL